MKRGVFNWKAFSVLSAAHLINDMYTNFLQPMLPFFIAAGLFNLEQGTTLVAAFTISSSLMQPIFGYLIDQKGQRWLLFVGTLWMSLLLGAVGLTKNYYAILVLSALAGMGTSAFHPQAAAMISSMGGQNKKGTALSSFIAFGNVGMALGPILLMPLIKVYGLGVTAGLSIPGLMAALLLYFYAPRETNIVKKSPGNMSAALKSLKSSMAELIKLMLVVAMRSLVFTGLTSLLPYYFLKVDKLSEGASGAAVSLALAAGAVGGIIGGIISDRLGKKILIVISLAASAPLMLLFLQSHGFASYILLAVGSAFLMASFSVTVVAAQDIIPDNKALASGLSMGFAIGIGGLGAKFIGKYADVYGVTSALHVLFYLPLLAAFFGLLLKREPKLAQVKA